MMDEASTKNNIIRGGCMKISPGPWHISASILPGSISMNRLVVEDCNDNSVCATSLRGVQGDIDKMHANANLIAAAPELLDTLIWLRGEIKKHGIFSEHDLSRISDAITLATAGQ